MTKSKSKKLTPSPKLRLWVRESRKAGARVEHLLINLLDACSEVDYKNFDQIEDAIWSKKELSSLDAAIRVVALEELFLCLRSDEELERCEYCQALRPISDMEQDDDLDGYYCPKCLDDIISEQETEDENFRTYFRGYR